MLGRKKERGEAHFLPSFRVSTCAFANKTFPRPKKTPALQAMISESSLARRSLRGQPCLTRRADKRQTYQIFSFNRQGVFQFSKPDI